MAVPPGKVMRQPLIRNQMAEEEEEEDGTGKKRRRKQVKENEWTQVIYKTKQEPEN